MYQYGYEVLMDTCVYGDDMDACMSLKVDGSRSLTRQVLRHIEGRRQLSMFGIVSSINIPLLLLCWFFGMLHSKACRPALHLAFLLPALAVGVWGQALPLLWLSAKEGIGTIAELPEFAAVFDDAIPFLGVQLMMMVVVMTATTAVAVRYFGWRKNATVDGFGSGNRGPRLIVNGSLQFVLAVCTCLGVVMVGGLWVGVV